MAWRTFAIRIPLILCLPLAPGALAKKKPPAKPVNINTATSEELQLVPGIGPATAEKILQMRRSYGAFKSVDDLLAIRSLGPKRLEKMRKYLTVGKPPAPKAVPPAPANTSNYPSSACLINPFSEEIAHLRSVQNTRPISIDL